ncbi:zinc finger and SCAN domain-containing protein 2-like [Toxorhynchites rutilus septentrionalis]|uniref:zinc finger and SCAN domain-containing protein 2-like n=1 Tax=Toxorhynchites rutilus septentrionalis TaxID=329112 RepID=UPI00247AAE36|nr:zinc finger and SCAN domain-containing protein 2-like [Toxorhynchites rutilus septentrionalis]
MGEEREVMEFCRTCMSHNSIQLVPLYSKLDDAFITDIIMECTSIQIDENDGLPTNICQQCMETLRMLTTFIRTARDSDRQLRQIFKSEYTLVLAIEPVYMVDSPKSGGPINDTDEIEFAEVKIEPSETLQPEEGSDGANSSDCNTSDGRDSLRDDSDKSSDETESDSDWNGSDQGECSPPRETKARRKPGPKPRPKTSDSDDRPALKRRKRKVVELPMNEYERELFTVIDIEKDAHICCGCLLIFDTAQELDLHRGTKKVRKRVFSTTKTFSKIICDGCLRPYKSQRRVNYHRERVRQLQRIWECNKCNFRFSEATRRRKHIQKHPRKEAIVAPIKELVQQELGWICCAHACGQSFPTENELIAHAQKAHQINKQESELDGNQNRPEQCQICYRRFQDRDGLINHKRRLFRFRKFQCALCGLHFNSGGRLAEHELAHQNKKPFKCEVCNKVFTLKGNLKTHMSVHTNEKPFQCTVCGMAFLRKGGLQVHMSNHVEKPQFKCEVCSKMFKTKVHLRLHMRVHNGERPYPCRYCEKSFTDFTNRRRHEMSHTGIKPYKCSYCEKSFIRKRFVLEHESTHTGVKLYNCDVCHQNFGQKSSLKKHMQMTHP